MERRSFLKGVFGGLTAAGVIVTASPLEIEAFASPLLRDAPVLLEETPSMAAPLGVGVGEHLYNAAGRLVAIVSRLHLITEKVEVTMFGAQNPVYLPGRRHFTIVATGIGEVHWDSARPAPTLVGVDVRR